jgi:hypothetical protein
VYVCAKANAEKIQLIAIKLISRLPILLFLVSSDAVAVHNDMIRPREESEIGIVLCRDARNGAV